MPHDEESGNTAANEGAPSFVELPDRGATDALGPLAYSVSIPLLGHTSDSEPDPEMVKRRAELAEQRKTGEWQAWFVELPGLPDPVAEALGISKPTRQASVPHLQKLYDSKVCKRMLKHPENWEVVEPLFQRWVPSIVPLIRVGALLDQLAAWPTGKLTTTFDRPKGSRTPLRSSKCGPLWPRQDTTSIASLVAQAGRAPTSESPWGGGGTSSR